MPGSVQDSARALRADCDMFAASPTTDGRRLSAPQPRPPPRRPVRRAAADRATAPPAPAMPRRRVQRTVARLNAAAVDGVDLQLVRRGRSARPIRQTEVPQALRIPAAAAVGRTTSPSPLQHQITPEGLALREEVDDIARLVDELLEVGEDGERKYRLT